MPRDEGGRTDTFSREAFIEAFPYLDERNRTMVLGSDLDALLSGAFLHNELGWEVVGFYTGFRRVYYTDRAALEDAVWVDLDINHPDFQSVGHHIVRATLEDDLAGLASSCNFNEERGTYKANFTRKYPLGTIHFLLWLHEADGFSPLQESLLLSADSAWINGQTHNYGDNVREWVEEYLDSPWLVDALETMQTAEFERRVRDEVFPRIESAGFAHGGSSGYTTSKHLDLNGWQCSFDDPRADEVAALVDRIGEVMDWEPFEVPSEMRVERGQRHSIGYDDMLDRYDSLDGLLEATDAFSFAIPTGRTVNYTTDIDL